MKEVIKEMSAEEAIAFYQMCTATLKSQNAVKDVLVETLTILEDAVSKFEKHKHELFQEFMVKDDKGNPILNNPGNPPTVDNIQFKDFDKFQNLFSKLLEEVVPVTIYQTSKNRMVITKAGEYELDFFLEHSTEISAATAIFLNEYFIHE